MNSNSKKDKYSTKQDKNKISINIQEDIFDHNINFQVVSDHS